MNDLPDEEIRAAFRALAPEVKDPGAQARVEQQADRLRATGKASSRALASPRRRLAFRAATAPIALLVGCVLLYGGWQTLTSDSRLVTTNREVQPGLPSPAGEGGEPRLSIQIADPQQSLVRGKVVIRTAGPSESGGGPVLGVSQDGQTIGIAAAPPRSGDGFLALFDSEGRELASQEQLLTPIPHDAGFLGLNDLVVASGSEVWLLAEYADSYRVKRLTLQDNGASEFGIHLSRQADPKALSVGAKDIWAGGGRSGESYPAMVAGRPLLKDEQPEKARAGVRAGESWVKVDGADEGKVSITIEEGDLVSSFDLLPPEGYSSSDVSVIGHPTGRGVYLLVRLRAARSTADESLVVVEVSPGGTLLSQVALGGPAEQAAGALGEFQAIDVDRQGSLYVLRSRPDSESPVQELEVLIYPAAQAR